MDLFLVLHIFSFKILITALEIVPLLYSPVGRSENVIMCIFRGSGMENQVACDFKCVDCCIVSATP